MHHGSLNGKNHVAWVILLQAAMRFLATAGIDAFDAIYDFDFRYDSDPAHRGGYSMRDRESMLNTMGDDRKRESLVRWIDHMEADGLLQQDVAEYLKGRAMWIKNRTNAARGI